VDLNLEIVDESAEALRTHLAGLEDGDLIELAELMTDLLVHPGWKALGDLVKVHQDHLKGRDTRALWAALGLGKPVGEELPGMRLTAGRVQGMAEVGWVLAVVLKQAKKTRDKIEREDGDDGSDR
jgi:hypothetical protein